MGFTFYRTKSKKKSGLKEALFDSFHSTMLVLRNQH
jgi:hypothetical protein